jgi:hypothetical protein
LPSVALKLKSASAGAKLLPSLFLRATLTVFIPVCTKFVISTVKAAYPPQCLVTKVPFTYIIAD